MEWKNNLLKLIAGSILFIAWTAIVQMFMPTGAEILVLGIQSALTGIGIIQLRSGNASDIINNIIKMVAGGGLMGIMGYLVYMKLASPDLLVADIGAALVSLGIIASKGTGTPTQNQNNQNTAVYIQNKSVES